MDITAEQLAYPTEGGIMRQDPFPSASVSLDGTINVVTYDCRFRPNCATNDTQLRIPMMVTGVSDLS